MPSKYFSAEETKCKCGECEYDVKASILVIADTLRAEWGSGIRVTSGARCPNYTQYLRAHGIPAALRSAHIEGIALDCRPTNGKLREFQEFVIQRAERLGIRVEDPEFTPQWCHFDLRPVKPGGKRVFRP